jgi:hypothetical protein
MPLVRWGPCGASGWTHEARWVKWAPRRMRRITLVGALAAALLVRPAVAVASMHVLPQAVSHKPQARVESH